MDGSGVPAIRSTCPYCGVGCGVRLTPEGSGGLRVEGDPEHPANRGRLCSKGLALAETLGPEGRLLAPRVDGRAADWDMALDRVAQTFRRTIERHGPDSVGFYVSGQLLTEDYYVANKLMKGFIGSGNIDTNSRLCMASTVAGQKRAFGTDTVPGTCEDLELADLVVLVGSNMAWCHPVLFRRLAEARAARGTRVVVVDPRRTATCDIADLHLKIRPGSDVALFNALLAHLDAAGAVNRAFVGAHVEGFDAALATARQADAAATGLARDELEAFFGLFAATGRTVTAFSQGVNQSISGTDKVNAILNCHLATGRIGRPGTGPLSLTGQPNAMGGRETGGMANTLAAHLEIENADHRAAVQAFWNAPAMAQRPGLKAVEMFRAAADGRIKALWIAGTNPVVSMPEADGVAAALRACDFVVVSDIVARTDTVRLADVALPALGWAEKDGTVTNSDRTISRQRAALPAPGQARADWALFAEVGRRMGWAEAFDFRSPAQIFREHARLSGVAGRLGRDFDISGLAALDDAAYDALAPVRWPVTAARSGGRFFGDGRFFTASGKARMLALRQAPPAAKRSPRYPFRLNTGRVRDQWHTMTRTGRAARLSRHLAEPFLQIHPADADALGLGPADIARVRAPSGSALLRVLISTDVAPGAPFAPMHWTGETAPAARIGPLVAAATDPLSGQPEAKAAVVAVERFAARWYGFAVARTAFRPATAYWARTRADAGWRAEMAGDTLPDDWQGYARALFEIEAEPACVADPGRGVTRLAFARDGVLEAALFVSPAPVAVARDYVAAALGTAAPDLLAARPGGDRSDPGPTVCACLGVGRNVILGAIRANPGADAGAICALTGAGTNCGSCRPEVADLLARAAVPQAAE
ncbi:molybdopterin-dependent oxidoreductase [Rhodobacteraceae bacterium 2CG4]|uniref:Molybdopterin-dependent oxidoreductase n=1 Tax=Halovulum marinum TaxID=2662447 RepID=A0A6L5Z0H3_9RHOB|nr:nitrate reductase [Halovulum marinum]MSU90066.1 molybdopterin-dependent oxidoreductase [Halovulum marinum]